MAITYSILIIIFVLGYSIITLEHKTGINKAASAILMATLSWGALFTSQHPLCEDVVASLNEHLHEILPIIVFLLGAMTIVELIDSYKGFRTITDSIATKDKYKLWWSLSWMTFFLSSFLDNLTSSIIMVSILRRLIPDRQDRLFYASIIIIAANAGGAWSPIGDVTTTMLWFGGQVSTFKVIQIVFIPAMVSLMIPLLMCISQSGEVNFASTTDEQEEKVYGSNIVFWLGVGTFISIPILKAVIGLPPFMGMLVGLGTMWVLTDRIQQERHYLRVPHIITKIDISSILFFLGVLLTVGALESAQILNHLSQFLDKHFQNKDLIVILMGIFSSIVDNVPLTAGMMGMYDLTTYPMDSKLWLMVAYAVGVGGNILIIGSAAGVVVMGMEKITFSWYLKKVTLPAFLGYMGGIIAFLLLMHAY